MHLSPDYHHRCKTAVSRGPQTIAHAVLKCYEVSESTCPITDITRSQAQSALMEFAPALITDFAGFVILHQCSPSFAFLLISTWRGNNELWQSVFYIDAPLAAFAPFTPAYPTGPNLRPTFCVWELGVVAHEALAWQTYLSSDRTTKDLHTWQSDCLNGRV